MNPGFARFLRISHAAFVFQFALTWVVPADGERVEHIPGAGQAGGSAAVLVSGAALAHTAQILPTDDSGAMVGIGDVNEQIEKTFENLSHALTAAGSKLHRVARLNIVVRSVDVVRPLEQAIENAKRLSANVRQNYARNPTCFDAGGNALPPEEAIEDTLDALVESIYDALPESVEVRRDGSYEADGEPWTREPKRKLRRKRPLTPHHLDVYFSTEVYVSTPDLFWEVRVQCEHTAGLVRDTAVFLIERRRSDNRFDLWYKEHLLSERPTKRHSWKTRQRSYRRVSLKPYLEAVNRAWAQYLEPNPAGTFAQREEVLGKRQRDAARMERALEHLAEHQKQVVNKPKTTVH